MITARLLAVAATLVLGALAAPLSALAQGAGYVAPIAAPPGGAQTIKVGQGSLRGSVADGVGWFLGIPYAAPPVGDLRWRPPGPAPNWAGVRDATKAGAVCQTEEDCLFLNVVRPAAARPGQKLPVMVWIHGGAFRAGTSMGGYGGDTDGHEFAKRGIVAVSVNYRLGRPGWFTHPALMKEGPHSNYGMMDQIAALKWVKANIAQLGGDPNNVTIFGESAGGVGVLYLMLSPDAKGLFNKAIAQSSFARSQPVRLSEAEAGGVELARSLGITGDDAAAAAALRKLPLAALASPPRGAQATSRPYPVLDGALIPSTVMDGFVAGRQFKIPLMIGGTSNEASLTRPTPELLRAMPEAKRATIMKVFDPQGLGNEAQVINDFVTAQTVTEPDRAIARIQTKDGAPAWVYYFSNVPAADKPRRPYGAAHTDELRFVFASPKGALEAKDLALADAMNAYWAAFAKTGAPGTAGGPLWPKWTNDGEGQIEFSADGPKPHAHFLKLWRDTAAALGGR